MGASLIKGVLANQWPADLISICEQNSTRRDCLLNEFPKCHIVTDCAGKSASASIILLAVKPQDVRAVCQQIAADRLNADTLVISIAAGVPTAKIRQWLNSHTNVVRCMPNTPAAIGHGITGLFADEYISSRDKKFAQEILSGAGEVIWVQNEAMLDAVTAISGSGPAYLFYFMECLQASAEALGLSAQDSYALTLHTMKGAALLAQEQDLNFAQLRANVTSKGGTTEQAINSLLANDFKGIVNTAVHAAAQRAGEINKSFNED